MFKDYYRILGVLPNCSDAEIKKAYREMSLRYHPDKNHCSNAEAIMVDINEAYCILKDGDKRARYNMEYQAFILFRQKEAANKYRKNRDAGDFSTSMSSEPDDYEIHDEQVYDDIKDANAYAKQIVQEFLDSLKKDTKLAADGAWGEMKFQIIGAIIASIIFLLIRTCS